VRHEAIAGLAGEQMDEVVARVTRHLSTDQLARPGGRPSALNLYGSVVLVIHLIRRNPVQTVVAEFFGVSQYSKKAGYPGMNVQIACDLDGELAAIGPIPVPGARHDAYAYAASGLRDVMDDIHIVADLGYVGVEGIDLVPIKRKSGQDLHKNAKEANNVLSSIRAAAERAVAHAKTWRMLSEEGGRFRPPLEKFPEMLAAGWGLINLKRRMITTYQ
jgi:hypothetical protein